MCVHSLTSVTQHNFVKFIHIDVCINSLFCFNADVHYIVLLYRVCPLTCQLPFRFFPVPAQMKVLWILMYSGLLRWFEFAFHLCFYSYLTGHTFVFLLVSHVTHPCIRKDTLGRGNIFFSDFSLQFFQIFHLCPVYFLFFSHGPGFERQCPGRHSFPLFCMGFSFLFCYILLIIFLIFLVEVVNAEPLELKRVRPIWVKMATFDMG